MIQQYPNNNNQIRRIYPPAQNSQPRYQNISNLGSVERPIRNVVENPINSHYLPRAYPPVQNNQTRAQNIANLRQVEIPISNLVENPLNNHYLPRAYPPVQNNQSRSQNNVNTTQAQRSVRNFAIPNNASSQNQPRLQARYDQSMNDRRQRFQLKKMDQIFAKTYTSYRHKYFLLTLLELILFGLLSTIYLIVFSNSLKNLKQYFTALDNQFKHAVIPILLALDIIMLLLRIIVFLHTLIPLSFAIKTSNNTGHTSSQPYEQTGNFQQNTSTTVYFYQNNRYFSEQQLSQSRKKQIQQQIVLQIQTAINFNLPCFINYLQKIVKFGIILCAMALILVQIIDQNNQIQRVLYFGTVYYWFVVEKDIFCIVLFLMIIVPLSPIILVIFVIYSIYNCVKPSQQVYRVGNRTGNREYQNRFLSSNHGPRIQSPRNPTQQQIIRYGDSCSVCLTGFTTSDEVLFFPCQGKHMFHNLCLSGWLNVKSTCPNCRAAL